jgi:hypothetical protein
MSSSTGTANLLRRGNSVSSARVLIARRNFKKVTINFEYFADASRNYKIITINSEYFADDSKTLAIPAL